MRALLAAIVLALGAGYAQAEVSVVAGKVSAGNANLIIVQKTQVGTGTGALGIYVSTTIPVTSSYETLISSGSDIVITSLPSISTSTVVLGNTSLASGTYLILTSTAAAGTITLQDHGTLAGSRLQLGASTRVIGQYDTLELVFDATDIMWREVGFTDN